LQVILPSGQGAAERNGANGDDTSVSCEANVSVETVLPHLWRPRKGARRRRAACPPPRPAPAVESGRMSLVVVIAIVVLAALVFGIVRNLYF